MKLQIRLLLSHLLVAFISIGVVILLATLYLESFEFRIELSLPIPNQTLEFSTQLDDLLQQEISRAATEAFVLGGLISGSLAVLVSLYMSRQIVRPVHAVVKASHYIASGHYDSRVQLETNYELGELARSFNQMAMALETTENTRRQLLADVSHELKTPLAGIKAYMEGFRDAVIPATPENFQQVYREADRLQHLVQGLHELSLVTEGGITIKLASHSVDSIVTAVLSRLRPQYDAKDIHLVREIAEDVSLICADRERLEQILINLLGNSLQYSEPNSYVTLAIQHEVTHICFAIRDTSIGLATDDLEKIFQRFYRVDKSRSRHSGGSGIGLTIARRLVEAHGGRLWAESPGLNKGSTFYFTIPRA